MKFFKNRKSWTNFARGAIHLAEPTQFPCLAARNDDDHNWEYFYADDIFKLAMKFRAEIQP